VLSTDPGTRADRFYTAQGWTRGGDAGGEAMYSLARPGTHNQPMNGVCNESC
jgi:hypothetical protein